ncbi:unnamed protein product, partial [Prorocentrum cordatum]
RHNGTSKEVPPPQDLQQRPRPLAPQRQLQDKQLKQMQARAKQNDLPEWKLTSSKHERRLHRPSERTMWLRKGDATNLQGSRRRAGTKKAHGCPGETSGAKDINIVGVAENHPRQPAQISKARAALKKSGLRRYWTKARPGEGEGMRGGTCAIARSTLNLQDQLASFGENYLDEDGSDVAAVAAEDGAPACFPAEGTARCLDYALASQGLAPYFDELELLRSVPWMPHIGVRLKLNG